MSLARNLANYIRAIFVDNSNGNVGIGTSSPQAPLDIGLGLQSYNPTYKGAIRLNASANPTTTSSGGLEFLASGYQSGFGYRIAACDEGAGSTPLTFLYRTNSASWAEGMRFTNAGNLLVGATAALGNSRLYVKSTGTGTNFNSIWQNSAGTTLVYIREDGVFNTGMASLSPYNLTTGAGANLHVSSDGTVYRSTSSLKYKTDVQDATHGLAQVMALRPVTYKGNNDGEIVFGGLIAEEVHEVGLTEFVQYAEDGTPDALAYANMVSLAFKAIQEQQAIIEQLRADVEVLKAAA